MNEKELNLVTKLSGRHFRKKNGLCLAEGLRCCREAVTKRPGDLKALITTPDFRATPHYDFFRKAAEAAGAGILELGQADFKKFSETETPQGILAILRIPEYREPTATGKPYTLILDRVADPGNMGTILRTAWAAGLDSCWLVKGSADPFSPKAVRSGMGAQFAMTICMFDTLEAATSRALELGAAQIWCTMPSRGISIFSSEFTLDGAALVIGNEANGISRPELGKAVTIPMPGNAESLNAAQAATVFLVEALRGK